MSHSRALALGAVPLTVALDGTALAERFDWRYPGEGLELPPDPAPAASLELRPFSGNLPDLPDDIAWQPHLVSTLTGTLLAMDWPGGRGSFDLAARHGAFEIRTDLRGFGLAIDDLLRVVGFELALLDGSALVHAAAVGPAAADWVDLFPARSDVGKTTLTERLVSAGESAISDDLVFVGWRESRPLAFPTPFKGATRAARIRRRSAHVRRIAFLKQASAPALRPLGKSESVARLLAAFTRYRPLEAKEADLLLQLAGTLSGVCESFELSLTREADPRAWING